MDQHRTVLDENLVLLCDLTNCTKRLLDKLIASGILTRDECCQIEREPQGYDRNRALYEIVRRKDVNMFGKLIDVMESEDTKQSYDILLILKLGICIEQTRHREREVEILQSKWWPDEKVLVNSFCERRTNEGLLIEELHKILTADASNTAVICQKVTVSGFGGIGKTTTAKWYAKHYNNNYDHIIWIDCGEGSLLKSFRELSCDLRIKKWENFELRKLAKECFLKLEDKKCLWIFDNAENYVGSDGISGALPSNPNFHTIVTSRNCEWGNPTGLGEIPQLQMDVFTTTQSVDFMRAYLVNGPFKEDDLRKMCEALGNLPLALQIAVATLNKQNIMLTDYLQMLSNTDHVLERKFDDYEKTINASLKASLDFLQKSKECFNELAYCVLTTFAYVSPDNVNIELFQECENCKDYEIQGAMKLLETYSLISTKKFTSYYSIHRLLQQVIRLNNKDRASDTIRKILSRKVDYGAVFTKNHNKLAFNYADEGLKLEFPDLCVEFIHQPELFELVLRKEYEEALNLSVIINNIVHSTATIFNHGICQKNCKMLRGALRQFTTLLSNAPESDESESQDWSTELINPGFEPRKQKIESQIFFIHLELEYFQSAKSSFESVDKIQCARFEEYEDLIVHSLNNKVLGETGYKIFRTWEFLAIYRRSLAIRHVAFHFCYMKDSLLLPNDLESLHLYRVYVGDEFKEPLFRFGTSAPLTLSVLEVNAVDHSLLISLDQLEMLREVDLTNCSVELTETPLKMCPVIVGLNNVSFMCGDYMLAEFVVNRYINLKNLDELTLTCGLETVVSKHVQANTVKSSALVIEMTGRLNVKVVELRGSDVHVENWSIANWNINRLSLDQAAFEKTGMGIGTLEANTLVELHDIPDTLDTLVLRQKATVTLTGEDHLSLNVNYLYVEFLPESELHINFLLRHCPHLAGFSCTEICPTKNSSSVDLDNFPFTIRIVHLSQVNVSGQGIRNIDKLVLSNYCFADIRRILTILNPTQLIIVGQMDNQAEHSDLVELIKYSFDTLLVGYINWHGDFTASPLFDYVDREGATYQFENQTGRVIDQEQFDSHLKFPPILY